MPRPCSPRWCPCRPIAWRLPASGLIGPPGTIWGSAGNFAGTPIFIGSSDVDPHVPLERVQESTAVLHRMGASVDERIYPRMGHTINVDELQAADALLARSRG